MDNHDKKTKGFSVAHLNICSLSNKIDVLVNTCFNDHYDILMLSETWLTSKNSSNLFEVNGYSLIRHDRNWLNNKNRVKIGGGLCMNIKNNMYTQTRNSKIVT